MTDMAFKFWTDDAAGVRRDARCDLGISSWHHRWLEREQRLFHGCQHDSVGDLPEEAT